MGPQGIGLVASVLATAAMLAVVALTGSPGWALAAFAGTFVLVFAGAMALAMFNERSDRRAVRNRKEHP